MSLVVFAISSVIISEHSQTASLNSHSSLITEGVNGLTDSGSHALMNDFNHCAQPGKVGVSHMIQARLRPVLTSE